MANSLRAKLSKLRHDGNITDAEYQELIKKLDGHDAEIYARGYNQGTIDRAEEVTKAREQGYAKAIDDFLSKIKEHYKLYKAVPSYYLLEEIAEEMRGAK